MLAADVHGMVEDEGGGDTASGTHLLHRPHVAGLRGPHGSLYS